MNKLSRLFLQSILCLGFSFPSLANSLVGTYYLDSDEELAMVIFLPDKQYMMVQSGEPNGGGVPGFERGTYTWDDVTEEFTCKVTNDNNGNWGFSDGLANVTGAKLELVEDGIVIFVPEEGNYHLSRVPADEAKIVNGWWIEEPGVPGAANEAGGMSVLVFLEDGNFFFAQDGDSDDDSGMDGIESGTYVWDPLTGAITVDIHTDTNGEWGFSNIGPNPSIRIDASGNFFAFDPDEGRGTVNVHRLIPGSAVISQWASGLGLTGEDATPNATPFPDGLPNVIRYALNTGSDPTPEDLPSVSLDNEVAARAVFSAHLGIAARNFSTSQQRLVLNYPLRKALVGVKLIPQTSPDLVTWTDVTGTEVEALPGDSMEITRYAFALPVVLHAEQPAAHRFLRLSARVRD